MFSMICCGRELEGDGIEDVQCPDCKDTWTFYPHEDEEKRKGEYLVINNSDIPEEEFDEETGQ
ncbi:MAG: hypothetical protein E2O29_01670 [Deltaproteobacteria bacterium]|nr:MAG: hypothetical protein E2O29_01670 [Deltaproteobacteria bacterium]